MLVGHVKAEVLHPSSSDGFRMTGKGGAGSYVGAPDPVGTSSAPTPKERKMPP
jgi:hypothetical protein